MKHYYPQFGSAHAHRVEIFRVMFWWAPTQYISVAWRHPYDLGRDQGNYKYFMSFGLKEKKVRVDYIRWISRLVDTSTPC